MDLSISEKIHSSFANIVLPLAAILTTIGFLILLFLRGYAFEFMIICLIHWLPSCLFYITYFNRNAIKPCLLASSVVLYPAASMMIHLKYLFMRPRTETERYHARKVLEQATAATLHQNYAHLLFPAHGEYRDHL